MDKLILYTVALYMYDPRMCKREDNPVAKYCMGDNSTYLL